MLNKSSLVSIVVPCYNTARFVAETIRSVIAQTYPNWELILIDDGSTDNIADVVKSFLTDPRIQFHVQTNQGVSAARNQGIAFSKGEFIAFLDSDDIWLPEKLQRQIEVFKKYSDIGVCGTNYVLINHEGDAFKTVSNSPVFYGQASVALITSTLSIPLSSGIVRKEVCDCLQSKQGFLFDETIASLSEDFDFWLRCSANFQFYKISEPLVCYRIWQGNATSNIWMKRQETILNEIIPRFCDIYDDSKCIRQQHIWQLQSNFYHERGSHPSMTWFAATYWFVRSLLCNPRNCDSWGALGHQFLPESIYRWLVNSITKKN